MNLFLSEYISTLSGRQQEKITTLLEEAKVGKEDIAALANRLEAFGNYSPVHLMRETPNTVIDLGSVEVSTREVQLRLEELFSVSNTISAVLDSQTRLLGSQVKALEDEIVTLEKSVKNYAFLLSEGGSFDYAYFEPFSDELGRDNFSWPVPDRGGNYFTPGEKAIVRTDEGTLVLSQDSVIGYPLTVSVLKGNSSANAVSSTDIRNAVIDNGVGWRTVIRTTNPVSSPLLEDETRSNGAQILLEFRTTQVVPAAQVKLVPLADTPMEILAIHLYESDTDESPVRVITSKVTLDKTMSLHFPMTPVKRMVILIGQPTYKRITTFSTAEDDFIGFFRAQRDVMVSGQLVKKGAYVALGFKDLFNDGHPIPTVFAPDKHAGRHSGPPPASIAEKIRILVQGANKYTSGVTFSANRRADKIWSNNFRIALSPIQSFALLPSRQEKVRTAFKQIDPWDPFYRQFRKIQKLTGVNSTTGWHYEGDEMVAETEQGWANARAYAKAHQLSISAIIPPKSLAAKWPGLDPRFQHNPPKRNETYTYEYTVGLRQVTLGTDFISRKGHFVSKPMNANGDIGQIRLKTSEDLHRLQNSDRASSLVASVEYSVSNRSEPRQESDWVPILPIGSTLVEGERFLFDDSGRGFFRFPASRFDTIELFRKGYRVRMVPDQDFIYSQTTNAIVGLRIPVDYLSSDDIYTVNYVPAGDATLIDFASRGFGETPLLSSFDEQGAGEGFTGTDARNTVVLSHVPYIDDIQVDTSTFTSLGLSPYQPVIVRLDDGSIAYNLTDYKFGQTALPTNDLSKIYFIHSNNILMFNQPITQKFRVYYQYLQSNVRVRVVLRVNDTHFVTPVVDYYQAKARTRVPDRGAFL